MKRAITRGGAPVLAGALAAALWTAPAAAQDPEFFAVSLGYHDIQRNRKPALEGRIEYRSDKRLGFLKTLGGLMATADGAAYLYAGVSVDVYLGRRWVVTPSFAPGLYRRGSGKDLGHVVEFRSQLEIAYRFDDRSRIGISYNHVSNASLGDRNPGVETLALTYAVPF